MFYYLVWVGRYVYPWRQCVWDSSLHCALLLYHEESPPIIVHSKVRSTQSDHFYIYSQLIHHLHFIHAHLGSPGGPRVDSNLGSPEASKFQGSNAAPWTRPTIYMMMRFSSHPYHFPHGQPLLRTDLEIFKITP